MHVRRDIQDIDVLTVLTVVHNLTDKDLDTGGPRVLPKTPLLPSHPQRQKEVR